MSPVLDPRSAQARSPRRLDPRARNVSWRTGIENQAARLQMILDEIVEQEVEGLRRDPEMDIAAAENAAREKPVLRRIQSDLTLAIEIVGSERSDFLGRLREVWTGSGFERALAAVNRASEMLLLVQPAPAVLARLPDLRAGIKDHLRVSDPRFDVYTRIIDAAERRAGMLPAENPSAEKQPAANPLAPPDAQGPGRSPDSG